MQYGCIFVCAVILHLAQQQQERKLIGAAYLTSEEQDILERARLESGAGTLLSTCDVVRYIIQARGHRFLVRVNSSESVCLHAYRFCERQVVASTPIQASPTTRAQRARDTSKCVAYIARTTIRWRVILVGSSGVYTSGNW